MPLSKSTAQTGGQQYAGPGMFVGPVDHTDAINVDLSGLTTAEVDANGWLKAGVPLKEGGGLADATAGEVIYGVTIEPAKVADDNTGLSGTVDVAVATIGQLNRAIAEDELGRAYTANELAAFDGSRIVLIE